MLKETSFILCNTHNFAIPHFLLLIKAFGMLDKLTGRSYAYMARILMETREHHMALVLFQKARETASLVLGFLCPFNKHAY